MTHRADVRQYAADAVSALVPDGRVFASRGYSVNGAEGPFIVVYMPKEAIEPQTIGGARYHLSRSATLVVEYVCEGSSDAVEDELDAMAEEIIIVLSRDMKFGGMVDFSVPAGVESSVIADEGSAKPVGIVQVTFNVSYRTLVEVTS